MRSESFNLIVIVLVLLLGSIHVTADVGVDAEQDQPSSADLEGILNTPSGIFNFNPPGARSLGMGGAFIAIADDATAAESNPAGLAILTQPEISINLRATSSENQAVNPIVGLFDQTASFGDSTGGPSFLSYARPVSSRNMAFSLYYQQVINIATHDEFTQEFLYDPSLGTVIDLGAPLGNFQETVNQFESLLEQIGFSIAFRIGPKVAIGASIRYTQLAVNLKNQGRVFVFDRDNPIFDDFTSTLLDRYEQYDEVIDDSDDAITINLGVLLNPNGKFSAGAVYKQGAEYDLHVDQNFFFVFPFLRNLCIPLQRNFDVGFTTPDSYGIGFAYRPNSQWTIGLDAIRVLYSDTNSRFADRIEGSPNQFETPPDVTEIHLGLEYGFTLGPKNTPVFVRAGYYRNPDHDASSLIDSEQNFITLGAGVFLKNKLQLDAALALSEDVTETLVSMVWRL